MCETCEGQQAAIDEAIIAVDAAVATLVMARIILERHAGDPVKKRQPAPIVPPVLTDACGHPQTIDISTMGGTSLMCNDCGETLKPEGI